MLHQHVLPILAAASVLASVGCKARQATPPPSEVKGETDLGAFGKSDLSQYKDADERVFAKMRAEFQAFGVSYAQAVAAVGDTYEQVAGMQVDEAVALYVYTGDKMFAAINKALRSNAAADDQAIAGTVLAAASGLAKIKPEPCTATRGTTLPMPVLQKLNREKTLYTERGFMSFTKGERPASPFDQQPHWISTTSPGCRSIRFLSKYAAEDEVLFAPGSEFYIISNEPIDRYHVRYWVEHQSTVSVVPDSGRTEPEGNVTAADLRGATFAGKLGHAHTFNADGTGSYYSPDDPQVSRFTWTLDARTQILTLRFTYNGQYLDWTYLVLARDEIQKIKQNGVRGGVMRRR